MYLCLGQPPEIPAGEGVEKAGAHTAGYIILRLCVGKELNSYSGMQFAIEKTNNKVFRMVYHK